MSKKTIAFHTLGCKVNRYETDAIAKTFIDSGYEIKDFKDICDVYVINTCTVTNEAERKSKQFIRRAKNLNPNAITVAVGCQVELSRDDEFADIVVGNKNKLDTIKYVENKLDNNSLVLLKDSNDDALVFDEMGMVTSQEETRAFIKIEDGCNNFCSYCAIPLARGRVRSRNEVNILQEAAALAKHGFKEIVLTGIHICSYTTPKNGNTDAVIDLANKISLIKGIERIRLSSLEPHSITEEFVKKIIENSKICTHFHLSLQSGSDEILEKMNRKYTTKDYKRVVSLIRANIPNATFTTDVIAGFPTETDINHEQSKGFYKSINFLDMHIFKYSKRNGTKASKMQGQISPQIMNKRSKEIFEIKQKMRLDNFKSQLGTINNILVEKIKGEFAFGFTQNYFPVKVKNLLETANRMPVEQGEIYKIKITDFDENGLIGDIII